MRILHPQEIRKFWPQVRPHLERIQAQDKEGWLPEDVFAAALGGVAQIVVEGEDVDGVAVLRLLDGWHGKVLHIWCASGEGSQERFDWFAEYGRECGCVAVEFSSSRHGWLKQAAAYGFSPLHVVYRRAL